MELTKRVKMMKFIGEIVAHPDKYKNLVHVNVCENTAEFVRIDAKFTGEMAGFLKELLPDVPKTLEA